MFDLSFRSIKVKEKDGYNEESWADPIREFFQKNIAFRGFHTPVACRGLTLYIVVMKWGVYILLYFFFTTGFYFATLSKIYRGFAMPCDKSSSAVAAQGEEE
ncbi:MAG TPA: hypothetical protein PLR20_13460 [Syntrophales bacterium]|nr:hypothetical protein [Syntrophales bacterium]HPI57757.1 hypothetical protein [Syntrophales bacterium]HPN25833.1 hypothetical protein [Syntrophales bacterium]HQM30353.1 hypothetical protein [Syntrophales bacterium]